VAAKVYVEFYIRLRCLCAVAGAGLGVEVIGEEYSDDSKK
jgi:hypothetical protein